MKVISKFVSNVFLKYVVNYYRCVFLMRVGKNVSSCLRVGLPGIPY